MLVLTRRFLESLRIGPKAAFAAKVVELLRIRCPSLSEDQFAEVGEALLQLRNDPIFNFKIKLVRIDADGRRARIGTAAEREWFIDREEVFNERQIEEGKTAVPSSGGGVCSCGESFSNCVCFRD